jgi:uncharacterized HAD superfamily protein
MTPGTRSVYVDIDDCLAHSTEALCHLMRQEFGKVLEMETIEEYDLEKSSGLDPDELARLLSRFHDTDVLESIRPIPESADMVRAWHDAGVEVWVVTGRLPRSRRDTEAWFATHEIPWSKMLFVDKSAHNPQSSDNGTSMSLGDVARVPFALAIDDSPKMAAWMARHSSARVFLMDRPWNRQFEKKHPDLAVRVQRINRFSQIDMPLAPSAR